MINLQNRLNELFEYKNGFLYRKKSVRGVKQGGKTGFVGSNGYEYVIVDGKKISTHRVVFVMHHGYAPILIDHIDGIKTNNRIENLREATKSQNGMNRKINKNNKCGEKNVTWNKKYCFWQVKINVNKKRIYIGSFKDLELASFVALEARNKYHKEFSNNGMKGQA